MFQRVKEQIKQTQLKVRDAGQQVIGQTDEMLVQARHKVHLVRGEGAQKLWEIEVQALDWADDVIGRAEVPGVDVVTEPMARIIQQRKENVTANPVADYDTLNARSAGAAVRELGWVELLRIESIERAGKGRKTVFGAIERRRFELGRPPFREAAA